MLDLHEGVSSFRFYSIPSEGWCERQPQSSYQGVKAQTAAMPAEVICRTKVAPSIVGAPTL